MGNLHLRRIGNDEVPDLLHYTDHTVFQTREWLELIACTQDAELVSAAVCDGSRVVGRYSGLVVQKLGAKILGSPFRGWTSAYMGFNLEPCVPRGDALRALQEFAFCDLKCIHLEIMDRRLRPEDYERAGYEFTNFTGYEIDLTQSEERLYAAMDPACRWSTRKAEREGVKIEIADDMTFVDEYYSQLEEVFARQKLVPTYSKERVAQMVKRVLPTGRLLLVKANDRAGTCIATGVFLLLNDLAYFWGGASRREYHQLRANEAMQWWVMRYLKSKKIPRYDMGGPGEYKRKFGGHEIAVPWGRKSRYQMISYMRQWCWCMFKAKQHVMGIARDAKEIRRAFAHSRN